MPWTPDLDVEHAILDWLAWRRGGGSLLRRKPCINLSILYIEPRGFGKLFAKIALPGLRDAAVQNKLKWVRPFFCLAQNKIPFGK